MPRQRGSSGRGADAASGRERPPADGGPADAAHGRAAALRAWLRPRAAVLVTAGAAGLVVGAVGMGALTAWTRDARASEATAFALGTLALGFGVVGWSGSVLAGRSVETAQAHLDTGTDWTEADSRRAMARIAGFGAGVMTGVSLLAAAL